MTLSHMDFDLEKCAILPEIFGDPNPDGSKDKFFLVNDYLVTFVIVTDRRTDGKRRIRAHRALAQVGSKTSCAPPNQ